MVETNLLKTAQSFSEEVLKSLPHDYTYHNLQHTYEVVEAAALIGEKEGLTELELEDVQLAAWFHDLGYNSDPDNHEEESIKLMNKKFSEWGVEKERIDRIAATIRSTANAPILNKGVVLNSSFVIGMPFSSSAPLCCV